MTKKKILFSAKLREIKYLLERGYLNKKGKEWANGFLNEEENDKQRYLWEKFRFVFNSKEEV